MNVRTGEGVSGSDRVTIVWPDGATRNQWLQVIVLPTPNTGLAEPDVFYFGNAVCETGNSLSDAKVNGFDMLGARDNPRSFLDPAPLDFAFDFNRDGRVNAVDMLLARDNATTFLDALRLITAPPGAKGNDHGAGGEGVWAWLGELDVAPPKRRAVAVAVSPDGTSARQSMLRHDVGQEAGVVGHAE